MARGSFVLDPENGAVLSVDLTAGPPSPVTTTMKVTYREDAKLKLYLPVAIEERYWEPGKPKDDRTEVSYTYTNFRRFQVIVDEIIK